MYTLYIVMIVVFNCVCVCFLSPYISVFYIEQEITTLGAIAKLKAGLVFNRCMKLTVRSVVFRFLMEHRKNF